MDTVKSSNVPYQKLKDDEPKFGPLRSIASIPPRAVPVWRKRQTTSTTNGKCFLISVIVVLSCFWLMLFAAYMGIRFYKHMQEEAVTRMLRTYPRTVSDYLMPGPARLPPGPPLHLQCPAMKALKCNREGFDGFSLREHQQRIDLMVGKAMLSGHLNKSAAVNESRAAFRRCVADFDAEKTPIRKHFASDVWEILFTKAPTSQPAVRFADTVSNLLRTLGVESFISLDTTRNYLTPEGDRNYVLYLSQKIPSTATAALMTIMRSALGTNLTEADFQAIYLNLPRIREMAADVDQSTEWQSFTPAEATARWPFFDFLRYFEALNADFPLPQLASRMIFVVKTPSFFDKLNAFFIGKNEKEAEENLKLFKLLSLFNAFDSFGDHLGIAEADRQFFQKYGVGNSDTSAYHFIYTYDHGKASHEALRACARDLRRSLPHIASALHSDLITEFPIHEAMLRFTNLTEEIRTQLARMIRTAPIGSQAEILAQKLEKMGITFTSRSFLRPEHFELFHATLDIDETEAYFDILADIRIFALEKKFDRLRLQSEAIRAAAFEEASAASVKAEYSRLGNWLNIPAALLTAPMLASPDTSPNAMVYSNIGWMLGREMAKAVDSDGLWFDTNGIHKRSAVALETLESVWRGSELCLRAHTHGDDLDSWKLSARMRNSVDEILGFQAAFGAFRTALLNGNVSKTPTESRGVAHFLEASAAEFCDARLRNASPTLIEKFIDTFLKRHQLLNCNPAFINMECPLEFVERIDKPLH